jgi:Peptidase M15
LKLTENFSDVELGVAGVEERLQRNARELCARVLEPVRARFGKPVRVHCGYRNPEHNRRVGGKHNSWHLFEGSRAAADFHVEGESLHSVFDWLRLQSELPFDKVILESSGGTPRCVHVQMDCMAAPRRLAYSGSTGAGTVYVPEVVA